MLGKLESRVIHVCGSAIRNQILHIENIFADILFKFRLFYL